MSTIAVTVATSNTEAVTADNFLEAAQAGRIKFHTVRADGTTRRVQFYADGTKVREEAEWVAEQRADGRTMRDIANELHMSIPSVRRILNALALAEEVEGYEPEEVEELLADLTATEEEPAELAAPVVAEPTVTAEV